MHQKPLKHVALIDMDATLCDYLTPLRAALEAIRSPDEPPLPDDLREDEPDWRHERRRLITMQPGFWRNLERIEAGFEVLEVIKKAGFQPHVLTKGPSSKPRAWKEKLEWCREHLDEGTRVTITEDKGLAYGRILFDDWPKYFLPWLEWRPRGLVIALAHPWNEHIDHPNVVRYDGSNLDQIKRAVAAAYARADGEALVLPAGEQRLQDRFEGHRATPKVPHNPIFHRYVGIDYSGAQTPTSSLKGLRAYQADRVSPPVEVSPPPSPRKYWTRRGLAEWLLEILADEPCTVVGIDHAFSFPMPYFEKHGLPPDWDAFLEDFHRHWPTDGDNIYVDFVRDGLAGDGAARSGSSRWKRLTDRHSGTAKSVFHFDVPGSVAKSTHAGIPWLRTLRLALGDRLHFWPFDGWTVPDGKSVIAEVYPALWNRGFPREDRTSDQHDAYVVARWLSEGDLDGRLERYFDPPLTPSERTTAGAEGWILGVLGSGPVRTSKGGSWAS